MSDTPIPFSLAKPRSHRFTIRFTEEEWQSLSEKTHWENMDVSKWIRRAIGGYGSESHLILTLDEAEWEYLRTLATKNNTDVETALHLLMEFDFMLLNMPLSKVVKPLKELQVEFQRLQQEEPHK